jgi:hypothetical protein
MFPVTMSLIYLPVSDLPVPDIQSLIYLSLIYMSPVNLSLIYLPLSDLPVPEQQSLINLSLTSCPQATCH